MLSLENVSAVRELREYFETIHVGEVLQSIRPGIPVEEPWPSYLHLRQCVERLPASIRPGFELFVLGDEVTLSAAQQSLGLPLLRALSDMRLLQSDREGTVHARGRAVVPFNGYFVFADLPAHYPTARACRQQVVVDRSTMFLARILPGMRRQRATEICAGAGLLSLVMSGTAERVVSCDLNAVAINAARFNAILNGLEDRVHFIESDLRSAFPEEPLDLIVSNPPCLASAKGGTVEHDRAGNGGATGMDHVYEILDQLVSRLGRDSTAYIMAAGYGDEGGPSARHRLKEMAEAYGWSTKALLIHGPTIEEYINLHDINVDAPERFASEVLNCTVANGLSRHFVFLLTIRPAQLSVRSRQREQARGSLEVLNSPGDTAQRMREMRRVRAAIASSAPAAAAEHVRTARLR